MSEENLWHHMGRQSKKRGGEATNGSVSHDIWQTKKYAKEMIWPRSNDEWREMAKQ